MSGASIDGKEIITRIIKYVIEGLAVGIAVSLVPKNKASLEEILTISLIAAAVFSILDMFSPAVAPYARVGSGIGIGAKIVGFP